MTKLEELLQGREKANSFPLDEWLQWISGTDSVTEDHDDTSEPATDLQEETTQSEPDVIFV